MAIPTVPKARSVIAVSARTHPDRDTTDMYRTLDAAAIKKFILTRMAGRPPLKAEHADELAALLHSLAEDDLIGVAR